MTPGISARERLLDAAIEAASIHGVQRLSMADVARRADLSRQTLYKNFSSKDDLVTQAVLRETTTMVDHIVEAADSTDDPRASLQAAIETTLCLTREHPLLDRLIRTEPEVLLPVLVGEGAVPAAVRSVSEHIIDRRVPGLPEVELRQVADLLSRLLVSYAVAAPDDPPEIVADIITRVVFEGLGAHIQV